MYASIFNSSFREIKRTKTKKLRAWKHLAVAENISKMKQKNLLILFSKWLFSLIYFSVAGFNEVAIGINFENIVGLSMFSVSIEIENKCRTSDRTLVPKIQPMRITSHTRLNRNHATDDRVRCVYDLAQYRA